MSSLGVTMSLAPVADLRVPGSYLDKLNRSFSSNPRRAGKKAVAWAKGLQSAAVTPVLKHWPGHGHATDTHKRAAQVPSFAQLQKADLRPFDLGFRRGVPAVMVAHVQSAGLTAAGVPASQSPKAIAVLRSQAGPDAVIMTDSLSMAAATSARGLSEPQAVVAALQAGVDWAMVCTTRTDPVIKAVAKAIRTKKLSKAQLQESAGRIRSLT